MIQEIILSTVLPHWEELYVSFMAFIWQFFMFFVPSGHLEASKFVTQIVFYCIRWCISAESANLIQFYFQSRKQRINDMMESHAGPTLGLLTSFNETLTMKINSEEYLFKNLLPVI